MIAAFGGGENAVPTAGGLPGSPGGDAVPTAEGLPGSPGGDAVPTAEGKRGQDTKYGFGRSPLSSFPRRARIK